MTSRTIKIEHEYEIRRIKLDKTCIPFSELNSIIHRIFANKIRPDEDVFLKYIDSDGDLVTISSEDEWKCAFETTNRMKLYVFTIKCQAQPNKIMESDKSSLTQYEAMEIAQQLVLIRSLLLRLIEQITADHGFITTYQPTKGIGGQIHLPRRSGNLSFYTSSENYDLPSLLKQRSMRLSKFSSSLSQLMMDTQNTAKTSEPATGISGISFKSFTSYPFSSFEFPLDAKFINNKPKSSRLNSENDLTTSLNRDFQSFISPDKTTENEPDKLINSLGPPSKRSSVDYYTPPLQSKQSFVNASKAMRRKVSEHNNLLILSEPPKGNSLYQLGAPSTNQALHCGLKRFTTSFSQLSSDATSGCLSDRISNLNSVFPIDIAFPEFSIPSENLSEVPQCLQYPSERIFSKPVVSSSFDESVQITEICSQKADHLAIIPPNEIKRLRAQTPERLLMSPTSLNLESDSSIFHSAKNSKQVITETNDFSQLENKSQKTHQDSKNLSANYVCDQVLTRAISSTSQTIMDAPPSNQIVEEVKEMISLTCKKDKTDHQIGFQVLDAKLSEESLDKMTNKCTEIVEPTVGLLPQFTIRTGELIASHADKTIHSPLGFQELVPEVHYLSTTISVVEQLSSNNNVMI